MDPINQLFNFVERCEHALVNLYPYLALMFIEMRIMSTFVHTVYCGNDLYAQVLLPYKAKASTQLPVELSEPSQCTVAFRRSQVEVPQEYPPLPTLNPFCCRHAARLPPLLVGG